MAAESPSEKLFRRSPGAASAPINYATSADAYAAVRRELRGIRADDVLQRAGYPDQPRVWVWIIRMGAKVGLVDFFVPDSSSVSTCRDSGIRPR